jgi:hypothetical protein
MGGLLFVVKKHLRRARLKPVAGESGSPSPAHGSWLSHLIDSWLRLLYNKFKLFMPQNYYIARATSYDK